MKYKHAPVSEVIIGVTFENPIMNVNRLFRVQNALSDDMPVTEICPPLANESLVEFRLNTEIEPQKAGPFLLAFGAHTANRMPGTSSIACTWAPRKR